jgi:hypothetical protein
LARMRLNERYHRPLDAPERGHTTNDSFIM